MTRRLKDPVLERYLAGALDEAATAALEKTLAESPPDAQRVAELKADSEAFLFSHPPAAFAARAVPDAAPLWRRPLLWLPLAAAVATAVVVLVARPPVEPDTGIKGSVALSLHRKTPAGSAVVGPDDVLHEGDVLRFGVKVSGPGAVAVFGRDAKGLTPYAPREGQAIAVQASALLTQAIVLDDAPGPERFVTVWAPERFDVEQMRQALAAGQPPTAVAKGALLEERSVDKR